MFDGLQILSNTTKHGQTRSNTYKHDQTAPNNVSKMFGHQTMFDGVWSPNVYRLSRPWGCCLIVFDHGWSCLIVFGRVWLNLKAVKYSIKSLKQFFCSRGWWVMFCSFGQPRIKPISFPELRSPWPAVGKRELWEHPFSNNNGNNRILHIRFYCACVRSAQSACMVSIAHAWKGCSQSSRFPTAGQGERSFGNEIAHVVKFRATVGCNRRACAVSHLGQVYFRQPYQRQP